ncbi:transposase [Micromonospora sp. AP08]|uniref:transposase n=1 Tax=Micromonospora sp. AP08 TaxID=2604467 RepID=UPI0011DBA170|nr:transposase [Micromonospora sp. AP08]
MIAIDGKTMRAAHRADGSQVHLLSALDTSTGIVLARVTVAAKSNEFPAFGPLLDAVEWVLGTTSRCFRRWCGFSRNHVVSFQAEPTRGHWLGRATAARREPGSGFAAADRRTSW